MYKPLQSYLGTYLPIAMTVLKITLSEGMLFQNKYMTYLLIYI